MNTVEETAEFRKIIMHIDGEITKTKCLDNEFYHLIRGEKLSSEATKAFVEQYFYYIRTFPKFLAGLSYRVDSEVTRYNLAKTVCSELGEGHPGGEHFKMFERAVKPLGITGLNDNWQNVEYCQEVKDLVDGIEDMFLRGPIPAALGGHYTVEKTGLPMIDSLYKGFGFSDGCTIDSNEYYYLHLVIEKDHVDWIEDAASEYANSAENVELLIDGAIKMAHMLSRFWEAMYRLAKGSGNGHVETASMRVAL